MCSSDLIAVAEGSGSMERFKGLAAAFEVGLGPTVLTNALLRFTQGGASLGEARVRGQVNLAEPELRLAYDVTGLDSRVLALVAAASGLDVGNGSVSASGRVDLLNSGSLLVMEGKLNGTNISAGTIRGRTRPADVNFLHRVTEIGRAHV